MAEGSLVNEKQLTQLSSDLVNVRAVATEAKARIDQLTAVMRAGGNPDSFAAAVRSGVIQGLREQHATIARREASLSTQLLARHPQLVEIRSQLAEIRAQIQAELRRLVAATKSEFEVAASRERELVRSLDQAKAEATRMQTAQIKLRELEREYESGRAVLTAYLGRGKETSEQQKTVTAEARIITPATTPTRASQPVKWLILSIGLLGGLGFGLTRAVIRDSLDRARAAAAAPQARSALRMLAVLPRVLPSSLLARLSRRLRTSSASVNRVDFAGLMNALGDGTRRVDAPYRQAVNRLLSRLRTGVAPGRPQIVSLVAAGVSDGASGTALALAYAAALKGERALLVDAEAGFASLSRLIAPDTPVDLLAGNYARHFAEITISDSTSSLSFLPLAPGKLDRLKSSSLAEIMATLRALEPGHDLIIMDVGSVLDDESVLPLIMASDQVLLVAPGGASTHALDDTILALEPAIAKVRGVVVVAA